MPKIKVAGAALNQIPIHWDNNLKNIKEAIVEARQQGVNILCLPELCLTGYGCEDLFLSEWLPAKACALVGQVAALTGEMAVTVGLPIRHSGHTYNCVAVFVDKELVGITAKQFLANDGVHYEPRWFAAWKAGEIRELEIAGKKVPFGDLTYDLFGVHTGFEICEDAWRPERPACRFAGKNVELVLNPSASHFAFGKSLTREKLVVGSSKTFSCYYVYANLLGNEAGRMIFDGEIVIAGHGRLLGYNEKLSFEQVNLVAVDIDIENHEPDTKLSVMPLEDKNDIFTRAASLALFDYMRKSHSKGFVLSLSGGADSSACAILVAEAVRRGLAELGLEEFLQKLRLSGLYQKCQAMQNKELHRFIVGEILHCAYQGTVNSSEETLESARNLSNDIGAKFDHWLIDEEVNSYSSKMEQVLQRPLSWDTDDIALQNIQARARSPIIWMLANIKGALLLVTSNRSEGDVGYATMDGDTSGSLAPIAAVDKFFILRWLAWAEQALGYESLHYVNSLNPTAELRPLEKCQTDEDDLMPYHVIVEIEKLAVRDRLAPKEIFELLNARRLEEPVLLKAHIVKFFTLWCRNQWKRERTAPAFHLDDFNVDPRTWCRFPILSSGYYHELAELEDL
ncbi:MAG: NAD+ synthetase [Cyclobacteriaceae bacterium]|nr:NAD+ synthetase [Cyclobacteriaceae bacterium]